MTAPNQPVSTRIEPFGLAAIEEAARLIAGGQLVAIPTETVYGLAADATNPQAVARIYAAKGRPAFNPLIVHVRDLGQAEELGIFDAAARAAAKSHWPGPLTLVVPLTSNSGIAADVTAGLETIALRCPQHPAMRSLLDATGTPLAAPSANVSGGISPTSAKHVLKSLGGRIALIVDGGPTRHGIESTIIAFTGDRPRLLRPGPLDFGLVAGVAAAGGGSGNVRIEAPGQLASHYAPTKPLRLHAVQPTEDEWMIGFGDVAGDDMLSESGNLEEAAANLFGALHRGDAQSRPRIAVAPIPQRGIGLAINDRLKRAAARPEAGAD